MADSGEFRADLYHRLNVIRLEIPPLRARREDIIPLARYFLRGLSPNGDSPADLSEEACSALLRFRWPGNVRQLRNEIAAALFRSDGKVIKRSDLSTEIICSSPWKQEPSLPGKLARVESEEIMEALRRSGGNRAAAARLLGIKRTTLLYRIGKLGLD
jgi:two-component system NtrC family response regulator